MATARTTKTSRASRSKADLLKELKELKSNLPDEDSRIAGELQKEAKARVTKAVENLSVEGVVQQTASLGLTLQRALAQVTEQLTQKVQELEDVKASISFENQELEKLYGKDIVAASIESLIKDYDTKNAELAAADEATRIARAEEQANFDKALKQRNIDTMAARVKEENEYTYSRDQKRLKETDQYNQTQLELQRTNEQNQRNLIEGWTKRENDLRAQEQEVATLRTTVAAMPDTIKKEVDKAVSMATNALKKDMEFKFAIEKKDLETTITIANSKVAQAELDKKIMADQILALSSKLEAAQKQVVEVASKAVDGAAGNLAMQKMQETIGAATQGRNGGKQ